MRWSFKVDSTSIFLTPCDKWSSSSGSGKSCISVVLKLSHERLLVLETRIQLKAVTDFRTANNKSTDTNMQSSINGNPWLKSKWQRTRHERIFHYLVATVILLLARHPTCPPPSPSTHTLTRWNSISRARKTKIEKLWKWKKSYCHWYTVNCCDVLVSLPCYHNSKFTLSYASHSGRGHGESAGRGHWVVNHRRSKLCKLIMSYCYLKDWRCGGGRDGRRD